MTHPTITFIGAGNMAQALIGGLIAAGHPAERIRAADPDPGQREAVAERFGVETGGDNRALVEGADAVVLAVKPQVIDRVLDQIKDAPPANCLVASVAAGVPIGRIREGLGGHRRVIRAMPNTPALYRAGVTGLVAGDGAGQRDRELAETVFRAAGEVVWVDDEAQMDVVTAVSGSGPAYFFALAEALAAAGARCGLESEAARLLAERTAFGAGTMLAESGDDAATLRRKVTSPGGTTEAALARLEAEGFGEIVRRAVEAAVARGRELGEG